MPKLWTDTIEAHRRAVREATLDAVAALVADHGLRSVTMSRIADETGIGRATLYKYFPDVEAVLRAWHERQVTAHLERLADARDRSGHARQRLRAVLMAYALIQHESHGQHDAELSAFLHRDEHVAGAERQVHDIITELLTDAAARGTIRDDVPSRELARYCIHALTAAANLRSRASVSRLVAVTLAGLRPQH